jgi:hypothetical protein
LGDSTARGRVVARGFANVGRAAETPFNPILEVRR